MTARPVKLYADSTLVFPLIVAETFAKEYHAGLKAQREQEESPRDIGK